MDGVPMDQGYSSDANLKPSESGPAPIDAQSTTATPAVEARQAEYERLTKLVAENPDNFDAFTELVTVAERMV